MHCCRILIENILPKEIDLDQLKLPKKTLKKGELYYFNQKELIIIKKGKIKVSLYEDKNEFILYFLTKYNVCLCFEDIVLEAIEESQFYILSPEKFYKIFNNPLFCNYILNALTQNLTLERDIIKNLAFKTFKQRTINFLIQMAENIGTLTDNGIEFEIKCTIEELANFLGTQRQTLSSFLSELKRKNLIKKIQNKFIIKDIKKLKKYQEV